ncbi:hypothetical protein EXIGLDRAFT_693199 [Exidia glandulosa HHB12029]|uniref:Chromo domain-containing protein n=1 Tax=Exidia glandulosa HHB12029 TaxID=1314781 RepID=A0A165HH49_EXIGL|nr:hypothetical protein EXIGLDRAFT_693199 [Exidia glandulosa HHB12029]
MPRGRKARVRSETPESEPERVYEVEYVRFATLVREKPKRGRVYLEWVYSIKWVGYPPEPVTTTWTAGSFNIDNSVVTDFYSHADPSTIKDMYGEGDIIFPTQSYRAEHGIISAHLARRETGEDYQTQTEIDALRKSLEERSDFRLIDANWMDERMTIQPQPKGRGKPLAPIPSPYTGSCAGGRCAFGGCTAVLQQTHSGPPVKIRRRGGGRTLDSCVQSAGLRRMTAVMRWWTVRGRRMHGGPAADA